MAGIRLLADEHVDSTYVTLLQSNGIDVGVAGELYPPGTSDAERLEVATETHRLILTNDRDFVSLGRSHDHPGILVYEQGQSARDVLAAIERIERYVETGERPNLLFWLSSWIE